MCGRYLGYYLPFSPPQEHKVPRSSSSLFGRLSKVGIVMSDTLPHIRDSSFPPALLCLSWLQLLVSICNISWRLGRNKVQKRRKKRKKEESRFCRRTMGCDIRAVRTFFFISPLLLFSSLLPCFLHYVIVKKSLLAIYIWQRDTEGLSSIYTVDLRYKESGCRDSRLVRSLSL